MIDNVTKSKILKALRKSLAEQEALYESLSFQLISINSYAFSKEWADVSEKYSRCADKINFLNRQIDIFHRTGKILGEPEEEFATFLIKPVVNSGESI